jgi:hypothetical protein
MKKPRYRDQQIAQALWQAEQGPRGRRDLPPALRQQDDLLSLREAVCGMGWPGSGASNISRRRIGD